jgi:hypothetical protein
MMDRVGWILIAALASLLLSSSAPPDARGADDRMKDKWAVVFFGEALEEPIPVIDFEKANAVDIYLVQSREERLELTAEHRADRSCVGMALFTIAQRADFVTDGRVTELLDPNLAAARAWLFPPDGDDPAMVQVGTETLQTVVPQMLEWLREEDVLPFLLTDLRGAGCDAPLP